MKLKPFDLAKAQAGHPWGTRDGRKGKKIFDTEREGDFRLITVFEDDDWTCSINGRFEEVRESELDIYLYEEEKIGWVVFYRPENMDYGFNGQRCLTEENKIAEEERRKADGTYIDTVEVRY